MTLYYYTIFISKSSTENIPIRFALRHCHETTYTHYSSFACHNEPTYILSRNCSNEYYGAAGPCCKVDDLFNYLINDRPDLFREIKFVLHGDDDSFFRADEIMRWLAKVDKSGFNHLPIISNADATKPNEIGVWHLEGCKDIHANGWYQPMMLNHAALERMKVPSASYGLRDTCKHFDLTHDIGVGVYAWLLELNHIQFPRVEINGGHKGDVIFQPDQMVVHCVKPGKFDTCIDQNKWPYPDRYVEKLVIGCGDLEKQYPTHKSEDAVSMYDAWLYFRAHGVKLPLGEPGHFEWFKANVTVEYIKDHMGRDQVRAFDILPAGHVSKDGTFNGKKIEERIIPKVYPLLGYAETEHKKKYDITNTWHEFTQKDCRINKAP